MNNLPRSFLRATCIAAICIAIEGCAQFSIGKQTELAEKVAPILETLKSQHAASVSELRKASANTEIGIGLKLRPAPEQALAEAFLTIACATLYKDVGIGLDILQANNEALAKISKAPTDSFAGITKSTKTSAESLKEFDGLKSFSMRMKESLEKAQENERKAKMEGSDCRSATRTHLERSVPTIGVAVTTKGFLEEINFFQSVVGFAKKLLSIREHQLRGEAVRRFMAKHESDFEFALQLLEGASVFPNEAAGVQTDELKIQMRRKPGGGRSATMSMVEEYKTLLIHKAFVNFVVARDKNTTHAVRLAAAENFDASLDMFQTVSGIDIDGKVLPKLRDFYATYITAILKGPDSFSAYIDALSVLADEIVAIDDNYKKFDKARGER